MKNLEDEVVDNDERLNIVSGRKIITKEDRYNESIRDSKKKNYPDKFEELDETLLIFLGENDPEVFLIEFIDKWKYLTKNLAHGCQYFNSTDNYQKSVDSLKEEDFSSKLKKDYPDDEEIERTKEIIKRVNIKNGEELTQIYIKTDVLLVASVFEKL